MRGEERNRNKVRGEVLFAPRAATVVKALA